MAKSTYNLNDNWIEEYHDKHGTFPTIKIPLKSLQPLGNRVTLSDYTDEEWDALKKSIKKKGLEEKIKVYEDVRKGKVSYFIFNGLHRACILNELKGHDYKVEVEMVQRRSFLTENKIPITLNLPSKFVQPVVNREPLSEEKKLYNDIKLKSINPINVHKESTADITKQVRDNLQKQIDRKLADIKSKSVNNKDPYNFSKVNKTYKDYL